MTQTTAPASTCHRENYLMGLRTRTRSFRLGIPPTPFYENLDPEIEAAVRSALEVLSPLTERSQEVKLPPTPDLFSSVADAETYAFHAPNLAKTPELYNAETRESSSGGSEGKHG